MYQVGIQIQFNRLLGVGKLSSWVTLHYKRATHMPLYTSKFGILTAALLCAHDPLLSSRLMS